VLVEHNSRNVLEQNSVPLAGPPALETSKPASHACKAYFMLDFSAGQSNIGKKFSKVLMMSRTYNPLPEGLPS